MHVYLDFEGNRIRLTGERLQHIVTSHPDMIGRLGEIEETPGSPDKAFPSRRDPEVRLYTRSFYENNDWVVVAVAVKVDDAFILTAYVTSEVPG